MCNRSFLHGFLHGTKWGETVVALIKVMDLEELLARGGQRARALGSPVLISHTCPVSEVDPLSFFAAGEDLFTGHRSYWADRDRRVQLVGLGVARYVEANGTNRYSAVETEWQSLLDNALVEPRDAHMAAGPVLLGGFSFDPLKPKSKLWASYADASFQLPRHLLAVMDGEVTLTFNVLLQPDESWQATAIQAADEQNKLMERAHRLTVELHPASGKIREREPESYHRIVEEAAGHIREGALEKVVLAREIEVDMDHPISPGQVLKRLHDQQAHSFLFVFERGASCFVGASPERLVKREGNRLISTCLAGSIPRGNTPEEDEQLGQALLEDHKNRVEHAVVVHMIREAFESECTDVQIPEVPRLYKVRDIQHLYTPVVGKAGADTSLLRMVERLHPTPALGGYPQQLSVEMIREMEGFDRGWYAAPIGWFNHRGDGEFAVAIRSGLLHRERAVLFAGCGIVGDSDPDSEYEETWVKFRPMLSALGGISRDDR
jgi:menaquinone-specific isochorismate synthase